MSDELTRERCYLSGPMSGCPEFNFPEFEYWTDYLRREDFDVISPHELDGGGPSDADWSELLARDIELIAGPWYGIKSIRVMDGWQRSRGARLETFAAFLCGKPTLTVRGKRVRLWRLAIAWVVAR